MMRTVLLALLLATGSATPASAKVEQANERGFVIRLTADVVASPEEAWSTLLTPAAWWNPEHSYSGDATNLAIEPRAGGCFCEVLREDPTRMARGGVEHMRVVHIDPPRQLRLRGALGPLQSEALVGTLTVELKRATRGGTQLSLEYVVGGYMRPAAPEIASAVNAVLGEQLARLAARLGPG